MVTRYCTVAVALEGTDSVVGLRGVKVHTGLPASDVIGIVRADTPTNNGIKRLWFIIRESLREIAYAELKSIGVQVA